MCDPFLVTLLKIRPHYSQSSGENATLSSGTSPLASYKEVTPLPNSPLGMLLDRGVLPLSGTFPTPLVASTVAGNHNIIYSGFLAPI